MAHYFHSPGSFFIEALQFLTNKGIITWEAYEEGIFFAEIDTDLVVASYSFF